MSWAVILVHFCGPPFLPRGQAQQDQCGKQPQHVIDNIRFRRSFHRIRIACGIRRSTGASLLDWPAVTTGA